MGFKARSFTLSRARIMKNLNSGVESENAKARGRKTTQGIQDLMREIVDDND